MSEVAGGVLNAAGNGAINGAGNSAVDSVIHDLGYRRYQGVRRGRWYAIGSLYAHSLRGAYGLGRGAKAKIFPWFVTGLALLVAVVVAVMRSQTGEMVLTYAQYNDSVVLLVLLFLAVVAPDLVSRDLRAGVLPLYFSRPLRRGDYALTKLGAVGTAMWLLLAVPQLLMFTVAAFSIDGGVHARWDEFLDLLPGLLYAGVYAAVLAPVSVLVASWCKRWAYAAGAVVAVFLVTLPVVGVLAAVGSSVAAHVSGLLNPTTLVQGIGRWVFDDTIGMDIGGYGPLYAVAAVGLTGLCVGLLLARYRRVGS